MEVVYRNFVVYRERERQKDSFFFGRGFLRVTWIVKNKDYVSSPFSFYVFRCAYFTEYTPGAQVHSFEASPLNILIYYASPGIILKIYLVERKNGALPLRPFLSSIVFFFQLLFLLF